MRNPKATFYVWCETPSGHTSESFCVSLLERAGVLCTPGAGFGRSGEGYVRFALTVEAERLEEALERMTGKL